MVKKIKSPKKQIKKLQKGINSKISMFERLPEKCSSCGKEFIKNKQTVTTWKVQVYNKEKKVLLYCPECDKLVKEVIKAIKNEK